jgi:hypothetical protein
MFADAAVLWGRAKEAFARSEKSSKHDRQLGRMDALDAVVFSVVALEGFINEVSALARQGSLGGPYGNPPSVESLGQLLGEVEKAKGSLRLKFMLVHWVFTGQTYDASRPPFQDFNLLIELRNAVVHHWPMDSFAQGVGGAIEVEAPKLLSKLESKNILAKTESDVQTSWLNRIATPASAGWACDTSSNVVNSVIDMVPECYFKESLKTLYQKHIKPVTRGT